MSSKGFSILTLGVACAAIASMPVAQAPASNADFANAAGQPASVNKVRAVSNFSAMNAESRIALRENGTIGRVYGKAFSHGQTGAESAQRFVSQHIGMWGVPTNELVAEGPFQDARHTQQIGYEPDFDTYKFTGHYYKQIKDGLPVFRSKLVLLTRNEANNPLVLASSELHDLTDFSVDPQLINTRINHARIVDNAQAQYNKPIVLQSTERMVYAGFDAAPHAPVLADISNIIVDGFQEHLVVSDAATGEILYTESLICTVDVTGNVQGVSSPGPGADICETESAHPISDLYVNGPDGVAITDENGDYVLSNSGSGTISISSNLQGPHFEIIDFLGSVETASANVTPPGPGNLLFNSLNNSQNTRAQVNAFIESNRVYDFTVAANPSYPGTDFQMNVTVNRTDGFCPGNAWYSPSEQSINFCLSGGSNPNTAWSSVVHHEYGHHIVNRGGSGQGQYGEGFGDVMSTIILDDNRLGLGFFGSCGSSLRNADNNLTYPCATDGHACAGLLSGCVWETRNEMVLDGVSDYQDVLNFLAVNSVLVHSGTLITPQITIDWLTLDDDDANIGNGTPHYNQIAAGFGAKNMDAPPIDAISYSYPSGLPEMVDPNGGTMLNVNIDNVAGTLDPSTATLMVNTGSGYMPIAMSQVSGNEFEAAFPGADCGNQVDFYITANTTGGATQNSPAGAPADGSFSTLSSFGPAVVEFDDNFQTNMGWTVSGNVANNASGRWERATPASGGTRGEPANDQDGSGLCYVTGNGGAEANNDVDNGSTILTSPVMDASGDATIVSYARWYDNTLGSVQDDAFVVEVSDNAGGSWTTLESVGPTGSETAGGWIEKQFALNNIPGFESNSQFQIRFTASDNGTQDVVEAGVDAVMLAKLDCVDDACPADFTGEGDLNFLDVSEFLALFGAGDAAADFTGEGDLNFLDVSEFLAAFAAGCP
jgi:hypothetical protein